MSQHGYRLLIFIGLAFTSVFAACGDDDATVADDDEGAGGTATSTTTTAATSTTTTGGSGGDGHNITCTVADSTNITGNCDILQQTGCLPGEGCEPAPGGGASVCVAGGLKEAGMSCTSIDECVGGTACIFNKCAPFCCRSNDEPCGGGFCNVKVDYGGANYAYVCSYPTICTLFEADQCAPNEDCHPIWEKGVATCIQPSQNGPKGEGEPCAFINDCADMMTCGGEGVCRYACDLANFESLDPGEGGCEVDQICGTVTDNQIPGVGLCRTG